MTTTELGLLLGDRVSAPVVVELVSMGLPLVSLPWAELPLLKQV